MLMPRERLQMGRSEGYVDGKMARMNAGTVF